jgi:sulfide:quinone oxidoreductase
MDGFRVVITGGGIAAVEGLLRLRRLTGDALDVTVLAPSEELRYRPLAVEEPFSGPGVRSYPLRRIAARTDARWIKDALEWVDPDAQLLHTSGGDQVPYDALLLAHGAHSVKPLDHATTFDDRHADDTYRGIVQDVEDGYSKRICLVVPEGPAWPLPAYELALMTAHRAYEMDIDDAEVALVTAEESPLAAFGEAISTHVGELLAQRRVRVFTGVRATVPAPRQVTLEPSGTQLEPERLVAIPRLEGRPIRNLPDAGERFLPIDERCRVPGLDGRVFAAGDGADFPVKQGGLGAQQADVAAAQIARLAGAETTPDEVFEPLLRGALFTGAEPVYLQARLATDGTPLESEVLREPTWPRDEKVVAQELGPFLTQLDEAR